MAESTGGNAASVDQSPSLASLVGEMYGDFSDAEPESGAGAPPDATPDSPASTASSTRSEGTTPSEPAGEPPVAADATPAPDSSTPDTPEGPEGDLEPDPLDGSKPLDYTVNGTAREFDGITVLKDGGGIIDPDAMAKVQRVFGERDHLYEQNQAQYERLSSIEKLSAWGVKDAQGNSQILTGAPALEARSLFMAENVAKNIAYENLLSDPVRLAGMITVTQAPDGTITGFAIDPDALENFRARMKNTVYEATSNMRSHLSRVAAPAPVAPPTEPTVQEVALSTIDAHAQQLGVTTLTPEDKQFLAQQLPRYVRATTPQEKQQGLGTRIVDAEFGALLQREAARAASTAKLVTTASTAASTNAARVAAASIGKGGKQPARITAPKPPEPSREDDFDAMWDKQERAAAGAIRAHQMGR